MNNKKVEIITEDLPILGDYIGIRAYLYEGGAQIFSATCKISGSEMGTYNNDSEAKRKLKEFMQKRIMEIFKNKQFEAGKNIDLGWFSPRW